MPKLRLTLLAAAATAAIAGDAMAGSVSVPMDNVTLVTFKEPVALVYVGNTSIADLTMLDTKHVFVLGKRFGATNLIALGADKKVLENDLVTVSSRNAEAITVFRGADTYNYVCTNFHCETRPVPGDPQTYFSNTEASASMHDTTAKAAATGMAIQQNNNH